MGMIDGIISLSVGVILVATVFIATVKNQSTVGWSNTEITLWGLLTILAIIGIAYGTMNVFGIGR